MTHPVMCALSSASACQPAGQSPAPAPEPRRDDRGRARPRARGLGPDRPSRRRGAERGRRPDLRRAGPARRHPPRRRLSDPPDRDDRRRGRGAVPGRPARTGRPARPGHGRGRRPAQGHGRPAAGAALAGARACVERFHLDASGWFQPTRTCPTCRPWSPRSGTSRECAIGLRPRPGRRRRARSGRYGVVLKGGVWYVVGAVDGQIRTYRASRVVAGGRAARRRRFERPADFDLAAYWAASSAAYERDAPTVVVDVRLRRGPAVPDRRRVRRRPGRGVGTCRGRPGGRDGPAPDAQLAGRGAGRLLAVGSSLEVLGPPEIRARVAATAARIVERYREAAPVGRGPERWCRTSAGGGSGCDRGSWSA